MSTGFGSVKERQDRQIINDNTEIGTDKVTGDKVILLPVFNIMSPREVVKGMKVSVLESHYKILTLAIRKVYMSFDVDGQRNYKDPRPFIYAGDPGAAYGPGNEKVRLAHIIVGAFNSPLFDDKNLANIRLDPFGYHDNNPCNLVPHNIIKPEDIELKGLPIDNILEIDVEDREKVEVTDKIKKAIELHNKNGDPSGMEKIILGGQKPTSTDAIKDTNFKWLGVSTSDTNQGTRFIARCKGQNLGTYENHVDAARAYNDFVIDNGLPYPVNNIPGFLKLKFVRSEREKSLGQYEKWELANELARQLMPDYMKF